MKFHAMMFAAAACLAAGCGMWAVGPDYREPEFQDLQIAPPDAGYATTNRTDSAAEAEDPRREITAESIRGWWRQFNDETLNALVDSAVSNNISFRMAEERLMQARWQLVGSAAAFMPKVSMDGTFTRSGAHKYTSSQVASGRNYHGNRWHSGFDAAWEIDIFGGTRRSFEQADAAMQAAGYTLAHAWVSLTSEIAGQYIGLRTVQRREKVARANLKLQSETYEILKSRLDSGIGDELAVNQARYNLERTRAAIPQLLVQEEKLLNALAVLTGATPGMLHEMLKDSPERDWTVEPQRLAVIPLNAMRARPDVMAAERELAAQVAAVGVARSLLFPKFYINGSLGLDSVNSGKFFKRDALMGAIGPSFSWPIFQGGNLVANMRVEESKMSEKSLNYELAIQRAFEETRNAYAEYTQEHHRNIALKSAVKAAQDAVAISQDLYKNGLADFNNVLDAQRSLLTLEEELAVSGGNISISLISLYKALGGGVEM